MDNIDEKLNTLFNDPNAMKVIMDLAQQLSGSEKQHSTTIETGPAADFDPTLLAKLMPLLQEFRGGSSDATKLLYALQPYLSTEKRDKVDRAVKLAHAIHIGKKFLMEGGWEFV